MKLFTKDMVEKVDDFMNEHMNGHRISNSPHAFVCSPDCRKNGLMVAINKVIREGEEEEREAVVDRNTAFYLQEIYGASPPPEYLEDCKNGKHRWYDDYRGSSRPRACWVCKVEQTS
jgi:hypothetical protein